MPHSLTLQINLENFDFFKYKFLNFLLSPAQKLVLKGLKRTHEDLLLLKKQDFFEFTASNEFHISRGADYAITEDLQKRFDRLNDLQTALEQKKICLKDLLSALEQKNNNLDGLLLTLEQNNINLYDLFKVLNEKKIRLEDLEAALKPKAISLEDLQKALENDYQVNDKEILSSLLLCLVEPIWIPGALSLIVLQVLGYTDYFCSNSNRNYSENFSKGFQVNTMEDSNTIKVSYHLEIIAKDDHQLIKALVNKKKIPEGIATICFSIEKTTPLQIKLLPITMEFNFSTEEKSKHFQKKLAKNFKSWLLCQNELDYIPIKLADWRAIQRDLWVFSVSIGLLIGLSAMISLIALGLTPISPLLLPPIGLALGLSLASLINSCIQVNVIKEQEKIKRPIHLLNKTPLSSTTCFFNPPEPVNSSIGIETPSMLNK